MLETGFRAHGHNPGILFPPQTFNTPAKILFQIRYYSVSRFGPDIFGATINHPLIYEPIKLPHVKSAKASWDRHSLAIPNFHRNPVGM